MPDWPSVAPIQTWSKLPALPYSSYVVGHQPGITVPYGMALAQYAVSTPIVVGTNGTVTVTNCTYSWETTAKMPSAINNAGVAAWKTVNLEAISPYGPGGRLPAWANLAELLLPSSSFSTFVMEFWGKWNAASAARADDRFWGLSISGSINNANRGVAFYRKTTGWSVISSDGTTVSEAVEVADTSDGNVHLFRIEWNDTNIKLYVDGTLKVTKTTNRPAIDASLVSQQVKEVGCYTNVGDGSPTWTICGFLFYWI